MADLEVAEAQLSEIDLLASMFPSQEEFVITDQLALAELRDYVEGATGSPPSSRPEFVLKPNVDATDEKGVTFTMSCTYVLGYPKVLPEISVRCPELSRAGQAKLHGDMRSYLTESCLGEVCVLSALEWLKDNAHLYIVKNPSAATCEEESATHARSVDFTRLWIYSHHIYNKSKRKNILEWAKELGLSGFSMPGKPGVVCVEGFQAPCEEFWARVRCLTWKRIMIKHREDVPLVTEGGNAGKMMDSLRRFTGFEETLFDPHGSRGNHMDLGQLYQYLSDKGCGDVFQLYFGIEGR